MTKKLAATIATVAWTVLAVAVPTASLAEDNARGEVLFDLCKQCHGPDGGGMQLSLAPAIAGLDQWYVESQLQKFREGVRGMHHKDLGGLRMYPMSLWLQKDEDLKAVAEYVSSMPRVSPDVTIDGGDAHVTIDAD